MGAAPFPANRFGKPLVLKGRGSARPGPVRTVTTRSL